jgi:hypothetical protein
MIRSGKTDHLDRSRLLLGIDMLLGIHLDLRLSFPNENEDRTDGLA